MEILVYQQITNIQFAYFMLFKYILHLHLKLQCHNGSSKISPQCMSVTIQYLLVMQ